MNNRTKEWRYQRLIESQRPTIPWQLRNKKGKKWSGIATGALIWGQRQVGCIEVKYLHKANTTIRIEPKLQKLNMNMYQLRRRDENTGRGMLTVDLDWNQNSLNSLISSQKHNA